MMTKYLRMTGSDPPPQGQPLNVTRQTPVFLPSGEAEEMISIRRADWTRIRDYVDELSNPLANAATWGFTGVGVAVTAGLSVPLVIGGTEDTPAPWLIPLLIILTLAAGAFSAFCFWVHKRMDQHQARDAAHIVKDMDAIEATYRPQPLVQADEASGSGDEPPNAIAQLGHRAQ
jgi:hypothetical protein